MQNRNAIKVFTLLFAIVCLYQLSFTWVADGVQDDASDSFTVGYLGNPDGKVNTTIEYISELVKVYKEFSQFILPELYKSGNKYDLIYIDASHHTDDVFVDAYYSHKMLNINGTIIFDDNLWQNKSGAYTVNKAIDFFEEIYKDKYSHFHNNYQRFYLKKNINENN